MQRVDLLVDGKLRVDNNRSTNPALIARVTRAFQTAADVHVRRHVNPPAPVPILPAPHTLGQRCVYFSQVTDDACRHFAGLGPGFTALLSADRNEAWAPGSAYFATDEQIGLLRAGGGKVASWCDGDQTPIGYAVRLKGERSLDFASGQFETPEQYRLMRAAGVPLGIGNPSALKDTPELAQAIEAVDAGHVALIGEVMSPNPGYSALGINVASVCFYVDRDANIGGYQPLDRFAVHPAGQRASCSVYTGGRMTSADWATYSAWTRL